MDKEMPGQLERVMNITDSMELVANCLPDEKLKNDRLTE